MNSILVSPLQVRCQHRRQYRPHQVSPLRRGKYEHLSIFQTILFIPFSSQT